MQQVDSQDKISIQGDQRIKINIVSTPKIIPSIELIESSASLFDHLKADRAKYASEHKIQQMLRLIFEHFCKRSYESKPNTFDNIKHEIMVLSLNKFMIFARDFGFIAKKIISMIDLVTIFRKCSANFKEMNFVQFKDSLVKISDQAFKKEEESERYRRLIEFMRLSNEQEFKDQMKSIKISIPESLIVPRHGSKFRIYPHCGKFEGDIKKEIEIRKEKKAKPIVKSVQRRKITLSPPSTASTKYSQIYATRTRNKFQLNNVVLMAKQQTQYSTYSKQRNYSSTKNQTTNPLQKLIEQQQQDQVLQQLYRKQRGHKSQFSNAIQQRLNRIQREQGRRISTQHLIEYR